jgi:REP element-mobilizing transposase RayT
VSFKKSVIGRLKNYDYSSPGAYFVTLCTKRKGNIFGEVVDGIVNLNEYGLIARKFWLEIPEHYNNVEIDAFVVMPDHVHGIIVILEKEPPSDCKEGAGSSRLRPCKEEPSQSSVTDEQCSSVTEREEEESFPFRAPSLQSDSGQKRNYGLLSKVIKSYKEAVVKEIRRSYNDYDFGWLHSYHDHIIRNNSYIGRIRKYIFDNPENWCIED